MSVARLSRIPPRRKKNKTIRDANTPAGGAHMGVPWPPFTASSFSPLVYTLSRTLSLFSFVPRILCLLLARASVCAGLPLSIRPMWPESHPFQLGLPTTPTAPLPSPPLPFAGLSVGRPVSFLILRVPPPGRKRAKGRSSKANNDRRQGRPAQLAPEGADGGEPSPATNGLHPFFKRLSGVLSWAWGGGGGGAPPWLSS